MVESDECIFDVKIFGAGLENAAAALAGEEPEEVVHAGLAGALVPGLARGDVVRAVSVALGEEVVELPLGQVSAAGLTEVRVVTSPVPVDVAGKQKLGEGGQGEVVEMESHPIAAECVRRGVSYLGLRVVGDALDDTVPQCVLDAWDGRRFRILPIARQAIFSASLRRELDALRTSSNEAMETLAAVLADALL